MKQKFTFIIAALFIAGLYSSCKKDVTSIEKKELAKIDQTAIARQMASDLYKSFSTQFSSNSKATSGLKTSGAAGCGLATVTPTNTTEVSGDTTKKYVGNSIFTTLCTESEWVVNAYTLHDTLKRTDTGPGFVNTYINTQYYNVKGPASEAMLIVGQITTGQNLRRVNNGVTNEFHDMNTIYNFSPVIINPFATGNKFVGGRIEFTTQTVNLSPVIPTGVFGGYQGFIYYVNNTARIYFRNTNVQGGYTRYILDIATGEMTGPVDSYPFPVDMN
jgi:hypothetical protein